MAILLAFLGVPIWLVVGVLLLMIVSRRRFRKMEGVFSFKARTESGTVKGFKGKYPWKSSYACWVHDVLLVHKGLALIHTIPLAVAEAIGHPETVTGEKVKRMGDTPFLLRFRLDNDVIVRLVVRAEAVEHAMGPFLLKQCPRYLPD